MNAPTPGWQPDPTGRHEYRYWDGSSWTDDVSDGGNASTDPMGDAAPTAPFDTTQPYGGGPTGPAGPEGPGGAPGYGPYGGSGQYPPAQPKKSGPSTGLLVGLGVLAVALIALVAVLVIGSGDDDEDNATDDTTEETTDDTSSDDTATDDTSSDDTATDDTGTDDTAPDDPSDDAIVDGMAAGIASGSDQITDEQAQCAAQAIVDELGVDTIMEMSTSGGADPFGNMSSDQQSAVFSAMTDCIPIEVLADIGMEQGG
jgi:Protein of unknown function (DUF2510)